jgi:hypothetical protein
MLKFSINVFVFRLHAPIFHGEITLYPPEVSTHFHFCFQSLKCDILPPQTFKLWQFNPFGLFIPKMPPTHFFFLKKKFQKKNQKNIYKYMLGWPNHPIGGGRPPRFLFFGFFLDFFFFF